MKVPKVEPPLFPAVNPLSFALESLTQPGREGAMAVCRGGVSTLKALQRILLCLICVLASLGSAKSETYDWSFSGSYTCGLGPGCVSLRTAAFSGHGSLTTGSPATPAGFEIIAFTGSWTSLSNLGTGGSGLISSFDGIPIFGEAVFDPTPLPGNSVVSA
jgi:hypothetical protein